MAYLRERRGPYAHAQLIGGEVSLLSPDDHAAALQVMRAHGRSPMSMTHGDFDPDYLRDLVTGPDGTLRLDRVSFAAHFDSLMRGRRGAVRPRSGGRAAPVPRAVRADVPRPARRDRAAVLPGAQHDGHTGERGPGRRDGARRASPMGYSMMSFQPAAHVGDERRWKESYTAVDVDAVWAAAGARAWASGSPYEGIEFGDPRCNRLAFGFLAGRPVDAVRRPGRRPPIAPPATRFFAHFGGIAFSGTPPVLLLVKIAPGAAAPPGRRGRRRCAGSPALVRRAGGPAPAWSAPLAAGALGLMTFEVHSFMDAAQVGPAWELMQRGVEAEDPQLRATQERLAACTYSMAHPETGQLVPACAQHSVLDVTENVQLRRLLPLTVVG